MNENPSAVLVKEITKALLKGESISSVLARVLSLEDAMEVVGAISDRDDILIPNWFSEEHLEPHEIDAEQWVKFKKHVIRDWSDSMTDDFMDLFTHWLNEQDG